MIYISLLFLFIYILKKFFNIYKIVKKYSFNTFDIMAYTLKEMVNFFNDSKKIDNNSKLYLPLNVLMKKNPNFNEY